MRHPMTTAWLLGSRGLVAIVLWLVSAEISRSDEPAQAGEYHWQIGQPLFAPLQRPGDELYSVKDPSIVQHAGRWHLFVTVRGQARSHQIEHISFVDWQSPSKSTRTLLPMHRGYFCAPQVFYFRPHQKWYLICQASDEAWEPEYGAAFSTTDDLTDPHSWSALQSLGHRSADGKRGLDFWVICDDARAHLFFTTNDGRMWREHTTLDDFPRGWSEPVLALQADVFEASHTYKLRGEDRYLTIIEAQHGHGWRYFKAYTASQLDGDWHPLAATRDRAFASLRNSVPQGPSWTESISHGEILRAGVDERLEIDASNLRVIFQGVLESERRGKPYGQIPWRLGLLEPSHSPDTSD